MDIIKKTNGQVWLVQSGNLEKILPATAIVEVKSANEIIVKQGMNQFTSIFVSEIDNYQIEPASPIAFSGNVYDLMLILANFFFELTGTGGSQDLDDVLTIGNQSGANDIIFDSSQGVLFNNYSRLREGTVDAGLGGQKGIAQICAVGYELKWEAGRLYVMDGNGLFIRWSLYNFNITPNANDDNTIGYFIGSRWTCDNGDTYKCVDDTTGAAIWVLDMAGMQDLDSVLSVGNSAGTYDIDMNLNDINNVSIIDFDSTTTANPTTGQIGWNDSFGTLAIGLKGAAIQAQLGQQEFARVVNKTTPLIALQRANYQVCIVTGATGQRLSVRLAQADSDANSAGTLGIVAEDIAQNQEGFIATTGTLDNLNTTGSLQGETWSDGDILYLSPTTAGAITNIKPTAPNHTVIVGYVEYSHINNGKIFVKIDNGYELDELHNVAINTGTLANNNILAYTSATQVWENKTPASVLGYTPAASEGWSVIVKSANQDVTNSTVLTDDTEFQFSVVAGGHYMLELDAVISANNTSGDYQFAFAVSAGTIKGQGIAMCNTATAVAQIISVNASPTVTVTTTTPIGTIQSDIDAIFYMKVTFAFFASANAIFKYQFSNVSAAAGRISRTWKGSILKYKRID